MPSCLLPVPTKASSCEYSRRRSSSRRCLWTHKSWIRWRCCVSVGLLAVVHLRCTRDELDLDFSMLPWHSMAAVRCQVLLGPHIALSASVPDPSSPKDLSLAPQEPDRTQALSFYVTCVLTSSHSCAVVRRRLVGPCSLLGLLTPASRGQIRAGTLVARSTSLRQTSSTATPHKDAGSSIIRHNVVNLGPSTPSLSSPFSAPVIIMLRLSARLLDITGCLRCQPFTAQITFFSTDARLCPRNLHCKTSRDDHPANSQNVLAFGRPRVS